MKSMPWQLLAMASQPVRAVILLFPITADSERKKEEEEAKIAKDGQPEIDPTILWIKQTVRSIRAISMWIRNENNFRLPMHVERWD